MCVRACLRCVSDVLARASCNAKARRGKSIMQTRPCHGVGVMPHSADAHDPKQAPSGSKHPTRTMP
eukprot:15467192-Alexandrium_andersonii.AAC.1